MTAQHPLAGAGSAGCAAGSLDVVTGELGPNLHREDDPAPARAALWVLDAELSRRQIVAQVEADALVLAHAFDDVGIPPELEATRGGFQ